MDYSVDNLVEVWKQVVKTKYKSLMDYSRKVGFAYSTIKKWTANSQKPNSFSQQAIMDSIGWHIEINGIKTDIFELPFCVQKEYQRQSKEKQLLPIAFWISIAKTNASYDMDIMCEVVKYLGMSLKLIEDEVTIDG